MLKTAWDGYPCQQMPKCNPFSRSGCEYHPQATDANGPLIFCKQLGRRHYPEGAAFLRVLLHLVTRAPHYNSEDQRQPDKGEPGSLTAVLLQILHLGEKGGARAPGAPPVGRSVNSAS